MLVRGKRVPIVGSVCMDMTMIDVTGMEVSTGDEVVIVGRQLDTELGMREIAAAIGTIPYELLCRVGARIERIFGAPISNLQPPISDLQPPTSDLWPR